MRKKLLLVSFILAAGIIALLQYRNIKTQGKIDRVSISYGESQKFERQEIEDAVDCVLKEFKKNYRSGDLLRLWYDEEMSDAEIKLDTENDSVAQNMIMLYSDFYIGDLGPSQGFSDNETYTGYEWILERESKESGWRIKSRGYA